MNKSFLKKKPLRQIDRVLNDHHIASNTYRLLNGEKVCNLLIPALLRCIEQRQKERNKNVNSISSQTKRPPLIFISYYVFYFMPSKSHIAFLLCVIYACVCAHGCTWSRVLHMLACRWQRSTFDVFPYWSPLFFKARVTHWTWSSLTGSADSSTGPGNQYPISSPPALGLYLHVLPGCLFTWVLRSWNL